MVQKGAVENYHNYSVDLKTYLVLITNNLGFSVNWILNLDPHLYAVRIKHMKYTVRYVKNTVRGTSYRELTSNENNKLTMNICL